MAPALLDALRAAVGGEHVIVDADQRAGYEVDWTGRFRGASPAVVRPGSLHEVAAVVAACRQHGQPMVAQGGNTGLVGGATPLHDEVVLSLTRLDTVGPVDVAARQLRAEAGATLAEVQRAAAAHGLRYAVDLGARDSATIGGTVATNAGGLNYVRFGGTREQLLGVQAVLGTGAVLDDLAGLGKDNTGYWLPGLLCGSEGTLGVITAVQLRLHPRPAETVTALVAFDSVAGAVDAGSRWAAELADVEALELMLADGMELVSRVNRARLPFVAVAAKAFVLVECAGPPGVADRLSAQLERPVPGVVDIAVATDSTRRSALWRYREEHTPSIATLGVPHKMDVTVPLDRLVEFLEGVPAVVAAAAGPGERAKVWLFGHLGDGNIHVNVTGVEQQDQRVDDAVLTYVAGLGGSISAEHGIGNAKVGALHLRRTGDELSAMRAIRAALDPDRVMNPHALLPS
jgi:FAD/FMN-containing dehydrogenase